MSEETNKSRAARRQEIIDRIIADRKAKRGESTIMPETQNTIIETPAGMTIVDLNEINLNEVAMPDAISERKWRQVGFGTEGETTVSQPTNE